MAKSKRYNPYEDAKNILKYKGNYHTAKQMGTNYDQYKEAAKPYYQNLRFNGYGDLADQFEQSDFIKAQDLFNGLKPDTTVDDYFADLYSKTAESQSTPKISQAAENLWNAYQSGLNNANNLYGNDIKYDSNGNVISGIGIDHYNQIRNFANGLGSFDVTAQPYYQGIMNSFQLQGNNAARGEQATGAANNAGNIDSYAQANANRQQLAFTSKGLEAALAAANQNQQNQLSAYKANSDYLNTLFGRVNEQNTNALDAYQNIYSTDSLERQNTLNTAAELAKQEMQSKIEKYLADVGYDQAVYTADKNMEGSKYKADANTLAAQIAADADRYTAQQNYAGKVYASDMDKAIAELKNGNTGTGTVYGGLNGDAVDAKTLARQVYDAYKTGAMPEVESQYDFERLLIAAGMSEKEAEEWAEYYLKHDKDMFKSNPASNSSSSSTDNRKIGGGLIKMPTGGNKNIYRP